VGTNINSPFNQLKWLIVHDEARHELGLRGFWRGILELKNYKKLQNDMIKYNFHHR
jgi:hypothetical protein